MEILDVGSGFRPKGTVNVDLSPKYKPTVVADGRYLPFKPSVFDGVYLSHILEHVIDPEKILEETHQVMKAGKLVTIIFPNFASLSVLVAWIMGFHTRSSARARARMERAFGGSFPPVIPFGLRNPYMIVYGSHSLEWLGEYDVHHVPLSLRMLCGLLKEFGFNVESIKGEVLDLPLRRFKFIGGIIRGLARVFPGRADLITIVARKI